VLNSNARGVAVLMQQEPQVGGRLRFGIFDVDLRAGELRKQGTRVRLSGQPFQVLAILLERPGEVVTREELQKNLWPADTFVDFNHGLNKAINKLRTALGDSAESPRFVETVARGYRFLAEVRNIEAVPVSRSETTSHPNSNFTNAVVEPLVAESAKPRRSALRLDWKVRAVLAVLLIMGTAAWYWYSRSRSSMPAIRSLAVLPFESLSNDASQDFFADGMTDQLITDLGQIGALRVISRTSAMGYKRTHKPLPQIARELNVDAVVEGTVLRSGDRVRITAQLIEASADKHLWAQSYEGELRETLSLQNQVATAIANQVRIKLNPQERAALKAAKAVNPDAYVSYLKGRYFWNKRNAESLKAALAYFNQAIEEDPSYAQAYSGLADTYALLGDWQYAVMTSKEALPKAKAAALKAIELDSSLGEAHTSLAFCMRSFDWNLDGAEEEFHKAIELNPGYATAHHWYAWHLAIRHRYDEAIAEMKTALGLDPLSLVINADLAELLEIAHHYDESIRQSEKTIEMEPHFGLAHNHLAQAYLGEKMYAKAIDELKTAVELSQGSPTCVSNLARAYVAAGNRTEALKLLQELKSRSSESNSHGSEIAIIYASLGNNDQAMQYLERAYAERFNPGVLLRPGFDPLRSDPRFQNLVRRIGLSN
jgi:TolB-like protein/DNA-binding winged helix-turn-helix (wHTH) protein/Tfp pilus assembly protein PilF